MTKQVQRRRGTAAQHTSFTGAEGEISVNTTNKSVHVHDGVTAGGVEAARADLGNVSDANLNAALSGNTLASLTITSADINGGTIDGTVIGGSTPAAISGTTGQFGTSLNVDGTVTANGLVIDTATQVTLGAAGVTNGVINCPEGLYINIDSDNNQADTREFRLGKNGTGFVSSLILNIAENGDVRFYEDTGTTPKFFWDASAESLGIGTSSPAQKMHIIAGAGSSLNTQYPAAVFQASSIVEANSGVVTIGGYWDNTNATLRRGYIQASNPTGTASGLLLNPNGGNVGIGTSSPAAKLTLSTGDKIFVPTGEALNFGHTTGSVNTERMRIDASGNVGIGTADPSGIKLRVFNASGTTPAISVFNGGNTADITSYTARAALELISYQSDNGSPFTKTSALIANADGTVPSEMQFWTKTNGQSSAAERMRIDASGNLLVGTTSANGRMAVAVADGTTNAFYAERTGVSPATLALNFANQWTNWNSSVRYQIVAGGSGGVFLGAGATSWASVSDERLKTTLTPFENPAAKVCALRAGTGRYLTDKEDVSRSFLIAQDVYSVLPEAVDVQDDEQGTLGLRYTDVVPLLTAALQEALQKIEALEARITALEA